MANKKETPQKLKPFVTLGFDYHENKVTGEEAYGECVFCGTKDHLYVNMVTGLWSCKAGDCQLQGNLATFVRLWHEKMLCSPENPAKGAVWNLLSKDRGLPIPILKRENLVHDGEAWYIPIRSAKGTVYSLRRYTIGQSTRVLADTESGLYGIEYLSNDKYSKHTIYLCEGEWDTIAMRMFLEEHNIKGIAIGVPGAGVWKASWADQMVGREIVLCYDKDTAGEKGIKRVWLSLKTRASKLEYVAWPESLPEGFDVRDYIINGGTWDEFAELIGEYRTDEQINKVDDEKPINFPPLGSRPSFEKVVEVFSKHLNMSQDMVIGLRIIYAVVLSNQIEGDPLWLHIVSPPGTAKTELLMPLSGCRNCYFASTLTTHSLVSGFVTAGGEDPSLLPKLDGKTFVLKDFTEILSMPKQQKDEVYGTLRGAYDGSVQKHYGNGQKREYNIRFNMISGVTHSIFGERSAALGERFLLFHLVKGVGFKGSDSIRAAIRNVGKEVTIRHDLHDVVQSFVEVKVDKKDIPELPEDMIDRIIALSSLVAMLRANVEKTYAPGGQEKMTYRPQHEMGTRLGKQLSKLALGLALVNSPPSLGEREYRIVSRVALDTCVGLNLEAIAYVIEHPGQLIETISEAIDIPITTLREQLEDMASLAVIRKDKIPNPLGRGAPRYLYYATEQVAEYWQEAGLSNDPEVEALPEKREVNRSIKRVRRHREG